MQHADCYLSSIVNYLVLLSLQHCYLLSLQCCYLSSTVNYPVLLSLQYCLCINLIKYPVITGPGSIQGPGTHPLKLTPSRNHNTNTYSVTSQYIISAASLLIGHLVRKILAIVTVKGYFLLNNYKFSKEYREIPGFAADLLVAVRVTIKTITHR